MSADGYLPTGCTHDDVERNAPAGDDHQRGDCAWCGEAPGAVCVSSRDQATFAPALRNARICRECAATAATCPKCRDLWHGDDVDADGVCLDCLCEAQTVGARPAAAGLS